MVAHSLWERGAASSSLAIPTIFFTSVLKFIIITRFPPTHSPHLITSTREHSTFETEEFKPLLPLIALIFKIIF